MKPIRTILISVLVAAGLVGGGTYYLVNAKATKDKDNLQAQITDLNTKVADTEKSLADAQAVTSTPTQTVTDATAGWKTYSNASLKLTFKYPSNYFVTEKSADQRIYISNYQGEYDKETMPADFQNMWISYSTTEASTTKENNVKAGNPDGRDITGSVTASTITAGSITINTYEYQTVGKALEAYWSNSASRRFYATNATEIGSTNQDNAIIVLKKLLATVQFTS